MKTPPTRGGKRPNAGRPKGTTGTKGRPKSGRTATINTTVTPQVRAAWKAWADSLKISLADALERRAPKAPRRAQEARQRPSAAKRE